MFRSNHAGTTVSTIATRELSKIIPLKRSQNCFFIADSAPRSDPFHLLFLDAWNLRIIKNRISLFFVLAGPYHILPRISVSAQKTKRMCRHHGSSRFFVRRMKNALKHMPNQPIR